MKIYLDNASTTQIHPDVLDEVYRSIGIFANPSSTHSLGQRAKFIVENSREKVARLLNVDEEEILFTSGGSESNSWAIIGTAFANKKIGNHIITTKIEHKSVLNACRYLEENHDFEITYINVDKNGIVNINEIKNAIKDTTILISVMMVNNEVGSIQPIEEISKIALKNNILFHTDCVQAINSMKINARQINVDLLSISGHKFYATKGIGALYIKKGTKIHNLIYGGVQENKKRAGTENVNAIAGIGKASEILKINLEENINKALSIKKYFIDKIKLNFSDNVKIFCEKNSSCNILSLGIKNFQTELLLLQLDQHGIIASGGSACTAGSLEKSYVLEAMNISDEYKNGFLRFSFSNKTSKEDIDKVIEVLKNIL